MKHILMSLALLIGATQMAQAACYADYKAKREDPLRLHYGVAEIGDDACTKAAARRALTPRLAAEGWSLLNIVSVFDASGLEERKPSAGPNYLRY